MQAKPLAPILAVLLSYRSPDAVFYLLPTRAWELFAGALACLFSMANLPAWQRKLAGLTGLALIATACWLLAEFGTLRILAWFSR